MKKIIVLFMVVFINLSFSQDNNELPSFNSLRTPVSPAFVLLGVEPISVERPNSPSAFAFSILNNVESLSALAKDFSVEASPYWLFQHSRLTWGDDINRNLSESILRTLTLSIAVADIGGESTPVKGLSAGIRASIISGKMSEYSIKNLQSLELRLTDEATIFAGFTEKYRAEMDAALRDAVVKYRDRPDKLEEIQSAYDEVINEINEMVLNDSEYIDSISSVRKKVQNFAVVREGFFLDFAAGAMWAFDNGIIDSGKINRIGLWLAPAYVSQGFNFAGLMRYLINEEFNDAFDYGARLIYNYKKFAVSGEFIGRSYLEDNAPDTEFRGALILEYEALPETWISVTIGKDFNSSAEGSLLAIAGINFNFNSERYKLE